MNIGMLWFDNDTKSDLSDKVERAASYYQKKYGKRPDLCYIHPSMVPPAANGDGNEAGLKPAIRAAGGYPIEVRTTRTVLPNHLWIGLNANGNGNGANGHVQA
jgi:hypothetical protein